MDLVLDCALRCTKLPDTERLTEPLIIDSSPSITAHSHLSLVSLLPSLISLSLPYPATFTFSSNNLQGPIPMEVCDLRDGELFTLGGDSEACTNDFYGGAYCPTVNCCPDCPVLDPS